MFKRIIASIICLTFSFSNLQYVHAQDFSINQLPMPGTMVGESLPFAPLALKGLIVNPQKPLEFQFIVDTGKGPQDTESIKEEANQLVKYFLAGLTIPEGDLWVNLSPYEKSRMVPEALGQTDLGRDLLAQDYILKQLTASLIYPEKDLGKEFWSRVYAKAQQQFGTTNVPVNTFNKVWILPNEAQVYENGNAAYVTKSTLKVMLDEDYLAKQKHQIILSHNDTSSIGANIVRQIILPEIEKEVNTGKNFAPLRQIYQALILAKWYKETIQNGLLDAVYTNKDKIAGVNVKDPKVREEIYDRYLKAYKKGAFNYIKEDPTPDGQVVPRKYFSGGTLMVIPLKENGTKQEVESQKPDGAMTVVTIGLVAAGIAGALGLAVKLQKNRKEQERRAQERERQRLEQEQKRRETEDALTKQMEQFPEIVQKLENEIFQGTYNKVQKVREFFPIAKQFYDEGYSFKINYKPHIEHMEEVGPWKTDIMPTDYNGHYPGVEFTYRDKINVIDQKESIKIERGDLLPKNLPAQVLSQTPQQKGHQDAAMLTVDGRLIGFLTTLREIKTQFQLMKKIFNKPYKDLTDQDFELFDHFKVKGPYVSITEPFLKHDYPVQELLKHMSQAKIISIDGKGDKSNWKEIYDFLQYISVNGRSALGELMWEKSKREFEEVSTSEATLRAFNFFDKIKTGMSIVFYNDSVNLLTYEENIEEWTRIREIIPIEYHHLITNEDEITAIALLRSEGNFDFEYDRGYYDPDWDGDGPSDMPPSLTIKVGKPVKWNNQVIDSPNVPLKGLTLEESQNLFNKWIGRISLGSNDNLLQSLHYAELPNDWHSTLYTDNYNVSNVSNLAGIEVRKGMVVFLSPESLRKIFYYKLDGDTAKSIYDEIMHKSTLVDPRGEERLGRLPEDQLKKLVRAIIPTQYHSLITTNVEAEAIKLLRQEGNFSYNYLDNTVPSSLRISSIFHTGGSLVMSDGYGHHQNGTPAYVVYPEISSQILKVLESYRGYLINKAYKIPIFFNDKLITTFQLMTKENFKTLSQELVDSLPIIESDRSFSKIYKINSIFSQPGQEIRISINEFQSQAMLHIRIGQSDKASLVEKGGIDLNQINVKRNGRTINVQFDPAQLNALEQGGFQGFAPVIINITPISSPFQLLGINPAREPEELAKV